MHLRVTNRRFSASNATLTPPYWIEVGHDYDGPLTSLIRALDQGGMVWEGQDSYKTLDEAFQDLEQALTEWFRDEKIVIEE